MTNDLYAYKTTDTSAIRAYQAFLRKGGELTARRLEFSAQFGRLLMVNRNGFGHGTRVIGFERLPGDKTGQRLHDGALLVTSPTGKRHGVVVPTNSRTGKELQARMDALASPTLNVPGMPGEHLYSDRNGDFIISNPAMFYFDGALYAQWSTDSAPIDFDVWEQVKLSEFYAAQEHFETAMKAYEAASHAAAALKDIDGVSDMLGDPEEFPEAYDLSAPTEEHP